MDKWIDNCDLCGGYKFVKRCEACNYSHFICAHCEDEILTAIYDDREVIIMDCA